MATEKYHKDFDGWNEYKKQLEVKKIPLKDNKTGKYRFKAGEIWYCAVGVNVGSEISGKNADYERPVLVVRKSGRHFIGLPLTSQKPKNSYFYYDISYEYNQEKVESYVLTTNPKSFDVLRLLRKVRRLNDAEFEEVKQKSQKFLSGGI